METGGPTALEIIFWILAANVILILAAYGLVRLLRKQSEEIIKELGEQIQEHAARLDSIAGFLQDYSGIQQEPFSTPLDELQNEASSLQSRLEQFLADCRSFEEDYQAPGGNQLQDIINAPINWFRRWQYARSLRQESQQIGEQLTAAEASVQRIQEMPWELSTQVRQIEKDVDELIQTARDLQSKNVRGPALQTILNQIPQFERGMNEIPREFLEAEHNDLLANANLDSTIRVFEVLNRTRPAVARGLPLVRDWQLHHQKASADYSELKQTGASLRQLLAHPPESLVITPLQARLDQVAQLAAEFAQRLAQPNAEDLKPLAREIARLRKVLQDTEYQFTRAGRQLIELKQAIEEQNALLEKLSLQFNELERSEIHPLVWDESGSLLNDLRQRLQVIGPASQPRTLEQIALHLKDIEGISASQKALADRTPHTAEQHRALIALLESPEIHDGLAWLRKSREMAVQTGIYDPRNWPKQDSVTTLASEIEELYSVHERLAPTDQTQPVKESELSQRLRETQQLSAQHKTLRTRVDSVRTRYEKIKAMEEEGKEKLTAAWTALERVALLDENNELLEQVAAAEIERLGEEIRVVGNELNAQGQGEIEKKIQKINAQCEKVNRSLNSWLARLNAAIAERGKQVQERLVQVETAAALDDAPVQEARALLSRDDFTSAALSSAPEKTRGVTRIGAAALGAVTRGALAEKEPSFGTLEATAEIKRKNDLWLTLLAVQTGLEEKSAAVLSVYQEVVQARNSARERLTELSGKVPEGKRAWPPNNQSPLLESQALQPIDDRWEAMRKQRGRADWAIQEMKRLAQQYQLTAERAQQVRERAEQDQERVQELEWQVNDLKQRWQAQSQAEPNNPVIREGVQQLMSQADSRLAFIKHQYMRGSISYEQVILSLQLLYDELYAARVSVDDQTDIGLNEVPRPVEQSNGRHQANSP